MNRGAPDIALPAVSARPSIQRASGIGERLIEFALAACSAVSLIVTVGIVLVLMFEALAFFREVWSAADTSPAAVVKTVLGNSSLWGGQDLNTLPGLSAAVSADLAAILGAGVRAALEKRLAAS